MNAVHENKRLRSKKDLGCETEQEECLVCCRGVKLETLKRVRFFNTAESKGEHGQ